MNDRKPGIIRRLFGGLWRLVDGLRRLVLNLIFLAIIAVVVISFLVAREPSIPDGSALVLRPAGQVVEQVAITNPLRMLQGGGGDPEQTPLRDLLEAISDAKDDTRIKAMVIETDAMAGIGLSKLQELRLALADFRASGKPIYAWGSRFTQNQYYLASLADEVYMAPDGFVLLQGYANYPTYFKGALDKLGVKMQVFRVGTYKSAVEPYTRSDMSPEDRESTTVMLQSVWRAWQTDVTANRKLAVGAIDELLANYTERLAAVGGDTARLAAESKLVDGLMSPDQWEDFLMEKVGTSDDGKEARRASLGAYLISEQPALEVPRDAVGVVVVQGAIVDGDQPPGIAGGETIARLLKQAREEDSIKALVLRVDSPGGSVYASERIRRELELVREAGKPVVVSMSSVAASGGYWVSMAADEVLASATTITGSIGIFGMFPDLSEPFGKLGLSVDGVATSPLAGAFDPRRPMAPEVAQAVQLSVDNGYQRFLEVVGKARRMKPEAVNEVAQGRVWIGQDALEKGLIDRIGGLQQAVASAARRAGIENYDTTWLEPSLSPQEQLLERLLHAADVSIARPVANSPIELAFDRLQEEAARLKAWNDPRQTYAHCLCEAP
ncbi:signal peptide peptidase SppA [Cognatazoarcus halotolerans]|uniref:signal peptide peptidase SppA n=1 Tax=Cognatazoarcus halotolerans TaxID=2686016 RepID=UPI00190F5DF5|nr:signal peptide peptidase SppA [Cognatazoarcus halotolerans]MCB1899785.1 signal peptide peptidase SppA [Rhodocyclaceae bacterium]MCP5307676.1 signal peptide peptidase SppA [Zoogloeaceae bacterium]MCP5360945.1 signal peptide peptidase SppA [Nevskiaceae bacterium]